MAFEQLRPSIEPRPSGRLALRLLPSVPEPCRLPADPLRASTGAGRGADAGA